MRRDVEVGKKKDVNEARLDAVKSQIKRKEETQDQIRRSLQASVDNAAKKASHIQFSDSDDDDSGNFQEDLRLKKDYNEILGFNNSESDSGEDEIKIKPQFQGKSGQELLELQSSYGNDKRFCLDERFAADVGELEVKKDVHEYRSEAAKDMEILSQVIGRKVATDSAVTKRKSQKFIDMDMQRFDPQRSQSFETKQERKAEPPTKVRKKKKAEPVIPEDSRKFYKTSTSMLKDAFADKTRAESTKLSLTTDNDSDSLTKPFSFLAMMGKDGNDDSSDDETAISDVPLPKSKQQRSMSGADSDSSDTDGEDEKMDFGENQQTELNLSPELSQKQDEKKYPQTFFMTSPNDPRMVDGVLEFCQSKSFEQIQKEWLEVKDTLIQDYKKKHKDAKRKAKVEERQERLRSYQT